MPSVYRKRFVERDLESIWRYIANDSKDRADAFADKVTKKFDKLARNPGIGRSRDELDIGLRSFPVGKHLVFYRILDNGIGVVRVLHGSRDIQPAFFKGDTSDFK